MKTYSLIAVLGLFSFLGAIAQNSLIMGGGVSMAYMENPATSEKGKFISGYHAGIKARIGKNDWYFGPGIELHVIKLLPEKSLDPFSDLPAMYLMKFPVQLGLKLLKAEHFKLRVAAGMMFSFTTSVQKNSIGYTKNAFSDTQSGALLGAGLDSEAICIDVNFEKGLTELYKGTSYSADYVYVTAGVRF